MPAIFHNKYLHKQLYYYYHYSVTSLGKFVGLPSLYV